ncbi:MAG: Bax inhibitor-1/YccA family protein [Flavobacteriales bacterium]
MNEINYSRQTEILDFTQDVAVQRKFFSSVFTYMGAGLAISGLLAYLLGKVYIAEWLPMLINETGIGMSIFGYAIMFSPLIFTLFMGGLMERASLNVLMAAFSAFAIVMGMSLSTIFMVYTEASILTIFFVTAATFALFAFLGYTTKLDLTKLGMICGIGFLALVVVSLINFFFIESAGLDYIMSGIGVLLVVGLIAYKMQHLKNIAAGLEYGDATYTKRALIGAFTLYISFINLFMFLLRLFGRRD